MRTVSQPPSDIFTLQFKREGGEKVKKLISSALLLLVCAIGLTACGKEVGGTLDTGEIVSGRFDDGWVEKNSEFNIKTGPKGLIVLEGYYPNEITGKKTGTITIDQVAFPFEIKEGDFSFEMDTKKPSKVVNIIIKNDFDFQPPQPDKRRLSFVLVNLSGE